MSKFRITWKSLKEKKRKLIVIIAVLSIISFSLPYLYKVDWIGFGEDKIISISEEEALNLNNGKIVKLKKTTEQIRPGKTFWDWLNLLSHLAIPILVVYFTTKFQRNEQKKAEELVKLEKEKTTNILNEEALQGYIDRISGLLIDRKVKSLRKQNISRTAILDVIRARTLSILRRLDEDGIRKGSIIRFLIDAGFTGELNLNLKDADLKNANLKCVDLNNINLSYADLSGTDLSGADLSGADLSSANLSSANLSGTNLSGTNLSDADLSGANLSGTKFWGKDVLFDEWVHANIISEQIKKTKNWEKAKYSPKFSKELGLPPEE